jgi:hypothetical protein
MGKDSSVVRQLNELGLAHTRNQGIIYTAQGAYYGTGQRNAPIAGQGISNPSFIPWNGLVVPQSNLAATPVPLPAGQYKLRIKGLKHFKDARLKGDDNFDVSA